MGKKCHEKSRLFFRLAYTMETRRDATINGERNCRDCLKPDFLKPHQSIISGLFLTLTTTKTSQKIQIPAT
jgi:hypothetical protein